MSSSSTPDVPPAVVSQGLMLEGDLEVLGSDHVLGLPIWVDFTFRNPGGPAIYFWDGLNVLLSFSFDASPPGLPHDCDIVGSCPVKQTVLAPHQKVTYRLLLNRYIRFLRAGPHRVEGTITLQVYPTGPRELYPVGSTPDKQSISIRTTCHIDLRDDPARVAAFAGAVEAKLSSGDRGPRPTPSELLATIDELWAVPVMARGLRALSEPDLARRVGQVLGGGSAESTMETLIDGLAKSGSEEAQEALRRFLRADASPELRQRAKHALKETH